MKNKKFKLFASLTSLVMVVAVMAVGVWAATSAKLTITTTASFSASGIDATVTLLKEGTTAKASKTSGSEAALSQDLVVIDNTLSASAVNENLYIALPFTDGDGDGLLEATDTLTAKFKVAKGANGVDFKYTVTITDATEKSGVYVSASVDADTANATTAGVNFTITYTVVNHDGKTLTLTPAQIPTIEVDLATV